MVPHASPHTGVIMRTCHTDLDCDAKQFCAKPAFMCQECVSCPAYHREDNFEMSCPQSVLDCGPCLPGDGCEPSLSSPANGFSESSLPVYVWVLVSLSLVMIAVGAGLCLFKLLKKKICADAEAARGAPATRSGLQEPGAPSARSPPPNYTTAIHNNNNNNSYIPVQLRPSSPELDNLAYNGYQLPSTDDEESRQMLAERSNSLSVTGQKERDLNQAAVVFTYGRGQEAPPSYDTLDEGTEDLVVVEEETRESEWTPEAASGPAVRPTELRGLLGDARGTVLIRPPSYDRDNDDDEHGPPPKLQRTGEEGNPAETNQNESHSSTQLSINDVTTTTQGSNAIALLTPRLDPAPSNASGHAHHPNHSNAHQSRAGTSGNPPPNSSSPPPQTSASQDGRESGNLMVNISIQQLNDVKYIKI